MSPTDRRTTAEALRALAVLNRESRRRGVRAKHETQFVDRPAEFEGAGPMTARNILPAGQTSAGQTPQEIADRKAHPAETVAPQTSEERIRQQAYANEARREARFYREWHRAGQEAQPTAAIDRAERARREDTPRRLGMPGLGGM